MRGLILSLLALALAAPAFAEEATIVSERPLKDRGIELTIKTPAFAGPVPVQVYLPAGYDSAARRRWPVTYYLAGTNHDEKSFADQYSGAELTADFPSIMVAPKGDSGYWSDWYNGGAFGPPKYETFVIEQLIPLIDGRFNTRASGASRAVFGESMGGYGTLMLAARHPDLFTAASSLSGSVDTNLPANASVLSASPALQGAAPDSIYGPRATQEIRWRGHNPWDLAENLRDVDLQVRTANGEPRPQDLASPADLPGCPVERAVFDASVSLHNRLGDLGVAHSFTNYGPGCHIASTFEKEITDSLPAFERAFAHPREVPRRFTYRSIEPHFEVWGWTVDADPDRPLEFLRMQDAGRTGLTLSGSGTTQVTTPPWFHGLRAVDVGKEVVQPDPDGRLSFSVDLSPSADVAFAPHARIRITRAGPRRVCARAIGGTVTRARARVRDATGQTMARTSRATLTRRARCLTLRLTRPLGRRPYTLVVHGRDAFGHRVRATRRR